MIDLVSHREITDRTVPKLKGNLALLLEYLELTRRMSEDLIERFMAFFQRSDFNTSALPTTQYEHKKLRQHLLPIQQLQRYEYQTQFDNEV